MANVLFEGLRPYLVDVTIGIFAIGQEQQPEVETFLQHHIQPTEGGLDASRVAVVEDRDVGREAGNEPNLLGRQRCAR